MKTVADWAHDLLAALKIVPKDQNVAALIGWAACEGGGILGTGDEVAHFNPLNTTQNYQGAISINRCGVKQYPTYAAGIAATIATLRLAPYAQIVKDLASNANADQVLADIGKSPWGTHPHWKASELQGWGKRKLVNT